MRVKRTQQPQTRAHALQVVRFVHDAKGAESVVVAVLQVLVPEKGRDGFRNARGNSVT